MLRYRSNSKSRLETQIVIANGELLTADPVTVRTAVDSIQDVVGNRAHYNPVSHVKIVSFPALRPDCVLSTEFGTHTYSYSGHFLAPGDPATIAAEEGLLYLGSFDTHGFLDSDTARGFTKAAVTKTVTQMPTTVSIANFLYELKDLPALIPKLEKHLVKTIAGGFLNLEFGWLPMVQDVRHILSAVADTRKRIAFLEKVNGRTVTIVHKHTFPLIQNDDPPATVPDTTLLSYGGNSGMETTVSYHEVTIRLNMHVKYALDFRGIDVFIKGMCATLGLLDPGRIVWNAIPFSFVLDWFHNFGDQISSATAFDPYKGTIVVDSVDTTYQTKTLWQHWSPISDTEWAPCGTSIALGYFRRGGCPSTETPVLTGLTPMQQALGAALVLANAPDRFYRMGRRRN